MEEKVSRSESEEEKHYMEGPPPDSVYIRVALPGNNLQRCMQFHLDDTIWHGKRYVLHTIAKNLAELSAHMLVPAILNKDYSGLTSLAEYKDGLNYGFYCPPMNGRAGKFLDEARIFREYPLPGPIGFLEFRYKRRLYRSMHINQSKMKKLHTKSNLRQFVDHIRKGEIDKLGRLLNKGLDPNFQFGEQGETPLTLAASMPSSGSIILSLVNNGAHLDYRNKRGLTPVHVAAIKSNHGAMRVLLDLGASPNYRDARELTPIYHAVCCESSSSYVMELLLRERALLGTTDMNGSTEIHQACRYGRVQHLEHLIFYGADMNAQNNGGNTPLHICAVNNQETCAKVLLMRGCRKDIENLTHQTPAQVAAVAGNYEIIEIINKHSEGDIIPFRESPAYNEKRRSIASVRSIQQHQHRTRSPAQRQHPASQASTPDYDVSAHMQRSQSVPGADTRGESFLHLPGGDVARCPSLGSDGFEVNSNADQSSLAGDTDSPPSLSLYSGSRRSSIDYGSVYSSTKRRLYAALPGRVFICVKGYLPMEEDELELRKGDFVDVLSVGEKGFWEGRCGQREGWFPQTCVEEVKQREREGFDNDTVLIRRNTLAALMMAEETHYQPRTVVLVKGKKGFGFVLKGAKGNHRTAVCVDEFRPSPSHPALQYIEKIDVGSVSDKAGLKTGDYLLEVNGENVVSATHDHCVELIRKSGQMLALKVVTLKNADQDVDNDGTLKRPRSIAFPPPLPPKRSPNTQLSVGRARSKSIAEGLAHLEELDRTLAEYDRDSLAASDFHRSMDDVSLRQKQPASIRSRPTSQRIDPDELNDLFTRTQPPEHINLEVSASNRDKPKINYVRTYANTAELKAECARRKAEKQNSIGGFMVRTQSTPNLAQFDDSGVDDWRTSLGEDDSVFQTPGSQEGSQYEYGSQDGGSPHPVTPDSGSAQRDHLYSSHGRPKYRYDSPAERRKRIVSSTHPKLESMDSRSSLHGDVVPISTKPEKIYTTPGPVMPGPVMPVPQDFESSFRPGTDARFNTAPTFKAQVRPPLHERIYANPVQQIYATPKDQMIYATPRQQNIYDAPRAQNYVAHGNDVTSASYSAGYGTVVSRRGDVMFRPSAPVSARSDGTMSLHRGATTSTPSDVDQRHRGHPMMTSTPFDVDQRHRGNVVVMDGRRRDDAHTSVSDLVVNAPYIPQPDYDHEPGDTVQDLPPSKPLNTGPSIQAVLLDRQARTSYRAETKAVAPKDMDVALANRASRTAYRRESKTPEVPLIAAEQQQQQQQEHSSETWQNRARKKSPSPLIAKPPTKAAKPTKAPVPIPVNNKTPNPPPPPPPVGSSSNENNAPAPPPPFLPEKALTYSRGTPSDSSKTPSSTNSSKPPSTASSKPSSANTTPMGTITAADLQKALHRRQVRMEEKARNPLAAVPKKKERDFGFEIREAVERRKKATEEKKSKELPSKVIIPPKKKEENPNFRLGTLPKREGARTIQQLENEVTKDIAASSTANKGAPALPPREPKRGRPQRKEEYDTLKLMATLRRSLRAKKVDQEIPTEEKPTQDGTVINGVHVIMKDETAKAPESRRESIDQNRSVPSAPPPNLDGRAVTRDGSFTARAERLRLEYLRRRSEQKRRASNDSLDSIDHPSEEQDERPEQIVQADKPVEQIVQEQEAPISSTTSADSSPNNDNEVSREIAEIIEQTPDLEDAQSIRSNQSSNSTPSSGFHDNYSDLSSSRPESLRNSVLDIDIPCRIDEKMASMSYCYPPDSGQHSPVGSEDHGSVHTLLAQTFRDKAIDAWTNDDIGEWLESLNLKEYASNFAEHEIDGSCLMHMTRHDFTDIGVTRVGHRMHMERSIKQKLERS